MVREAETMNTLLDFLSYSLRNDKKILVVLQDDSGVFQKKTIKILGMEDGIIRYLSGKKEKEIPLSAILSAGYARGDHGEIETMVK